MPLSKEQRRVARILLNVGTRRGASRKEKIAALETGLVESGLRNLSYGDRDSVGWRQERSHYGSVQKRMNVRGGAKRFYRETAGVDKQGLSPGELAQAVQRSAFPGKYAEVGGQAKEILQAYNQGRLGKTAYERGKPKRSYDTKTIPGVDNTDTRRDLKLQYLSERDRPGSLLTLAAALKGAADVPAEKIRVPGAKPIKAKAAGAQMRSPDIERTLGGVRRFASKTSAKKLPYVWGGGHGATFSKTGPYDCSGAVSAALGINPRVSGQFASWGKPGWGKRITVFANAGHVLMAVKKGGRWRFWGTSKSNPGGGAGWIAERPSASYLAGFSVRHPRGL